MTVQRSHEPYVDHDFDKGTVTIHAVDHLPYTMSIAVAEDVADLIKFHTKLVRNQAAKAYAQEYR